MSNFIQNCLQGDADLEDIDDYIDAWHDGDSDLPIYHYLGMTELDYKLWVGRPEALPFIIAAHRQGAPVALVIKRWDEQALPMAARSANPTHVLALKEWLEQQGLWGQ